MKPYPSLKSILAEFFPLHRTHASDDHDKTLEIVGERAGLKPPAQHMEALRAKRTSRFQPTSSN